MTISGIVQAVIFRSEDTGYTVMDFATPERSVIVVGSMPEISEGEYLQITGKFVNNSKYGEQFSAESVDFSAPVNAEGMIMFLGGGLFDGIGPSLARSIVSRFGAATLEIIEKAPEKLELVPGIGKFKAKQIAASYRINAGMKKAMLFLQGHGISLGLATKIYNKYGDETEQLITENPYRLTSEIDGVGFYKADRIAEELGFGRDSEFRITAGLKEALSEAGNRSGHTALPIEPLTERASELLKLDPELVSETLKRAVLHGEIAAETVGEGEKKQQFYALNVYYYSERSIARKIMSLLSEADVDKTDFSGEIDVFEAENNIYLDATQREAVQKALNSGVSVITGGPGTGKTTIIKCILELTRARNLSVLLSAPTGRAAKRLTEATSEEAKTIHRMLGQDMSDGRPTYKFNESHPLKADVVIVDEISMADVYVFSALLKALPNFCKLILVGDKDQLPSVSPGNILADLIESGLVPVHILSEIHRQDAGSLIVVNAHRLNEGKLPIIKNDSSDFFFDVKYTADDIARDVVALVTKRLPEYFRISSGDIQVLAPLKRTPAGVIALNEALQQALNPFGTRVEGSENFRVGDKVMQIVNDYELEWEKDGEKGRGVFNGDLGYILSVVRGTLTVAFDDGRVAKYKPGERDALMLAYAVSVHKSQGSEFPVVVIALTPGGGMLLNRNLLYTAVTRAKRAVVLVGAEETVRRMIANKSVRVRYTLLKEFLWKTNEKLKLLLH